MTARYEPIERWKVPRAAISATLRGILRAAADRHEGGAFWLGTRAPVAQVHTVVLLDGPGVIEQRGFWEISPAAYGVVGEWASARGQVLLAVVHSHQGQRATWLSALDRSGGVHVPDVLALVVPGFGSVRDPLRWGIHRFDGHDFAEMHPKERDARIAWTGDDVIVTRASEKGVIDA
jgi:hypothetical protein